ncbi:hypothetical protein L7F22_020510 [Adiantum nelumboides]|nr:hypothetical protein [Adiantum nelumboides]MCO5566828.1 hypothetical protein [Adiantum nelumboides]
MCLAAHTRRKLIEASSQRPPGQATKQSPLARPPPKHTPRKPPSNKAPLKRPPIEPANKKRKKRGRGKSVSSEEDKNIEEDPYDEEADDVLDIDSQPIENLDGEDDPLGDLPDPLPRIDIAEELWYYVDDHTCDDLAEAAFTVAYEFMVAGGVIIALCMPKQYITIVREAQDNGFEMIQTMYLHMNAPMFISCEEYTEPTQTLLLAMFVRGRDIGLVQWRYNRAAGQEAASDDGFGERVDMLWEPSTSDAFKPWRTYHNREPLHLGVEKSTQFARWLLGAFTEMGDVVMDIFAGTRGVASQCLTLHQHCISIEVDRHLARTCLAPLQRVSNDLPFRLFFGEVFRALQHQQAMTLEREFYDASSSHAHMRPPSVRPPMSTMSPIGSTVSSWSSFGAPYFRPSLPILQPMPYPYIPY